MEEFDISYSEDKELINELIKFKKLDIYFLHQKYKLSPAQVARSVNKFLHQGLIQESDSVISFTELGIIWVNKNRKSLFNSNRNKYWKEVPRDRTVNKKRLYLPLKKEDKHF